MPTDLEIAQAAQPKRIQEIAEKAGIPEGAISPYGQYIAKVDPMQLGAGSEMRAKLILVTAINPTPAGEGKTTVSVGLADGMTKIGKKAMLALREPSLGPVFGMKGGACGGGHTQVLPMDKINLHFTGDFHAITAAHNLIAALLDNYIFRHQGEPCELKTVYWGRVLDVNDRALRKIVIGLGAGNGVVRESGFDISVASEIMAILCLADDLDDLKDRLGRILVAYTYDGKPVYARDIKAVGSMTALLRDAINPNLVQTLENNPAIIHGGPFANIAHGCNSVRATKLALKLGDYCITEAGFGSDLGAEKFFDIKCRFAGLKPDCVVLVATIRALKYNGGVPKAELSSENLAALEKGIVNLGTHIENMQKYGVPVVVAVNHFHTDTDAEIAFVTDYCKARGVEVAFSDVFLKGGEGGVELAKAVVRTVEEKESRFAPLYDEKLPIKEKLGVIAKEIYRADGVIFTAKAEKEIKIIEELGYGNIPVCVAKTQYSLSDDPAKLGKPENFEITVRDVKLSAGAGFVVALTGDIMTMPGLPKVPAANNIDVAGDGTISGLF